MNSWQISAKKDFTQRARLSEGGDPKSVETARVHLVAGRSGTARLEGASGIAGTARCVVQNVCMHCGAEHGEPLLAAGLKLRTGRSKRDLSCNVHTL